MSDFLRRLRGVFDSAAARHAVPSERPGADAKLTRPANPKRTKSPEPLERPADISPEGWEAILERPPCTLTSEQLAVNDKVFAQAVERAAREVESTPPPEPWSPWPWTPGPVQTELQAKEAADPFPRWFK